MPPPMATLSRPIVFNRSTAACGSSKLSSGSDASRVGVGRAAFDRHQALATNQPSTSCVRTRRLISARTESDPPGVARMSTISAVGGARAKSANATSNCLVASSPRNVLTRMIATAPRRCTSTAGRPLASVSATISERDTRWRPKWEKT